MKILLTGGAGFIGSSVIRNALYTRDIEIINVDILTYAGNLDSLAPIKASTNYTFEHVNICDAPAIAEVFAKHQPTAVMHLAAESHVDRSIDRPSDFIQTNIIGTYTLLEQSRIYWQSLTQKQQGAFRFHHISTDEVYGDLKQADELFTETTSYAPSSPYAASKASSDHLVRAWQRTFGLPTLITNCSNNYGPYHFPEKLIPHVILNALAGKPLPIYGDGLQIRDWLYVDDHARALLRVISEGEIGETYNIGGYNEKKNLDVVKTICNLLEELAPNKPGGVNNYKDLITFVRDRPGHDLRYAVDARKISQDLDWQPRETFESGMKKTVGWYLANQEWCQRVLSGKYRLERLGGFS